MTGVVLAVLLVYVVGLLAGNFIGRAAWALAERTSLRIPLIRAIYPAVKQITDFVLSERSGQFVTMADHVWFPFVVVFTISCLPVAGSECVEPEREELQ